MNWFLGYLLIGTCVALTIMSLRLMLGDAQSYLRELEELKGESVRERLAFAGKFILVGCINILVWPINIALEVYNIIKGW